MTEEKPSELTGQQCPFCGEKALTLRESNMEVPFFGNVFVFSMTCTKCKYHKADVELPEGKQEPCKYTVEINSEEDMKIRVIRSADATIKIPHITTISPGTASSGYVTNVEGILKRIKRQVEVAKEDATDPAAKKKAKNMLKKLQKVMWGQDKIKMILEDPTGNSAIVSEKAVKEKMKAKK